MIPNKILAIILVGLIVFAVFFSVQVPYSWEDPITDPDGNQIGTFKQKVKLTFEDGSTQILTSGSGSLVGGYVTFGGKHVTSIAYLLDALVTEASGAMMLDLTNYKVTFNVLKHDTGEIVTSTVIFDYSDTGYPYLPSRTITGSDVNYMSCQPSWNLITLYGTYDFKFITSGTMLYSLDAGATWNDCSSVLSAVSFTVVLV